MFWKINRRENLGVFERGVPLFSYTMCKHINSAMVARGTESWWIEETTLHKDGSYTVLKVYMTDFFICSIKSPQCADKCSKKKFFDSDFPSLCFDLPKASNFTSGGVQNRETKNRGLWTIVTSIQDSKPREKQISPMFSFFLINNVLLYHFLENWLAHNKKMTEKSGFREAWSPELTSQSFPVSCFWCRGFVPHRKWNLTLLAHQNMGKENRYRKKIFATLVSTLWRVDRANKKSLSYTL